MWFFKTVPPSIKVAVHVHVRENAALAVTSRPEQKKKPQIIIPTDLMFAAFRQLFPAERMIVCGGRRSASGSVQITSVVDVTEPSPSTVHVRACPQRLAQALIDFERTGAHFGLWLHSHPGETARATHPSDIDINQERELRQHYSGELLCAIAVRDGYLRFWGETVKRTSLRISFRGAGVETTSEDKHVYKLKTS